MTTEASSVKENQAKINALNKSQGTIEFNMDGTVITANDIFLDALGYSLEEVKGKHHRMFCEQAYVNTLEYKAFWEKLNRGEFDSAEYKRIGKNGRGVYLQATYNPISDLDGKPIKVLKIATDVTRQKLMNSEFEGKINAINKSQGTIEFNMDGTVITANDIFLTVLGYSLEEVKGKHHRMFCEESYVNTLEYKAFWEKLNRGEFDSAEYRRIGKNGRGVYLQATYNPIFDLDDKPIKVMKIAMDVTEQKQREAQRQSALIREISTPAIQLWDRIVILPVIGVIDSLRAQQMMNTLLTKIMKTAAKVTILDIQGVAAVDTAVANHLIKIVKAAKLMGCRCIISGISPAVAETMVQLGINMEDVATNSTLQDALSDAFDLIHLTITEK